MIPALRLFAAIPALLVATATNAQDTYLESFANAASTSFTAQIEGTYPAEQSVLVKLANRNQFALPVAPDTDLSAWKPNQVVEVTITTGKVVGVETTPATAPTYNYEVLTTTDMTGTPADSVVRLVTITTTLTALDPDKGLITFVAPTGEEQTALMYDIGRAAAWDRGGRGMVEIKYYDEIDIVRK